MVKSFYIGIVFGIGATAAALWFVPAVDQHREPSLVSVAANGGNRETFHVNLPQDRIVLGAPASTVPDNLAWPSAGTLAGVQAEIFKLRDGNDTVVGVASRVAGPDAGMTEWVLHLPARGTLYAGMRPEPGDGFRDGVVRAGTQEFAGLQGSLREKFLEGAESEDEGGRIELTTALIAIVEAEE